MMLTIILKIEIQFSIDRSIQVTRLFGQEREREKVKNIKFINGNQTEKSILKTLNDHHNFLSSSSSNGNNNNEQLKTKNQKKSIFAVFGPKKTLFSSNMVKTKNLTKTNLASSSSSQIQRIE